MIHNPARSLGAAILSCFAELSVWPLTATTGLSQLQSTRVGPHCVHYFLSERLIGSMVRSEGWQICSYGLNFVTSLKVSES